MVTVKDCFELMEFGSKQSLNNIANQIKNAINATNTYDTYAIGFRNGLRYCLSLIDGKKPEYEMDRKKGINIDALKVRCKEADIDKNRR